MLQRMIQMHVTLLLPFFIFPWQMPAVMQRSETEAAALVAHLPPSDSARLRAFALALRCAQRCLHIHLPGDIVCRMLSLFDS